MKGILPSPSFRETKTAAVMAAAADIHRQESSNKMKVKAAVGCLPGILFFFQRHHSNSRKRLSSGSRSEKSSTPTATPPRSPKPKAPPAAAAASAPNDGMPAAVSAAPHLKRGAGAEDLRSRCRCNDDVEDCHTAKAALRTPSLPQELRLEPTKLIFSSPPPDPERSITNPAATTPRTSTASTTCRSPALVARLMGLDGLPPPPQHHPPESASEKRQKLLTALEKCDEDLQALRKIIEALRIAEVRRVVPAPKVIPAPAERKGDTIATAGTMERRAPKRASAQPKSEKLRLLLEQPEQEPSPVSVLAVGPGQQHPPFGSPVRTRGEYWHEKRRLFVADGWPLLHGMLMPAPAAAPWAHNRRTYEPAPPTQCVEQRWKKTEYSRSRCSKGMLESVGEVCDQGVWEERWERGRVGMVMEGGIFLDLVEELVEEMMRVCLVNRLMCAWPSSMASSKPPCGGAGRRLLPFEACRRSLRF